MSFFDQVYDIIERRGPLTTNNDIEKKIVCIACAPNCQNRVTVQYRVARIRETGNEAIISCMQTITSWINDTMDPSYTQKKKNRTGIIPPRLRTASPDYVPPPHKHMHLNGYRFIDLNDPGWLDRVLTYYSDKLRLNSRVAKGPPSRSPRCTGSINNVYGKIVFCGRTHLVRFTSAGFQFALQKLWTLVLLNSKSAATSGNETSNGGILLKGN